MIDKWIEKTDSVSNAPGFGIAGYLDQFANYADFESFIKDWAPEQSGKTNFSVELTDEHSSNSQVLSEAGSEANLDVQWGATLAYPVQPTFYSTSGRGKWIQDANSETNTNEPFELFLNHLLHEQDIPAVLSTSYGENEQTVPVRYAKKVCKQYAALSARGMTAVHASGDGGVTGASLFVPSAI